MTWDANHRWLAALFTFSHEGSFLVVIVETEHGAQMKDLSAQEARLLQATSVIEKKSLDHL